MGIVERSFVLGCELWEENSVSLLLVVKESISDLWEVRKVKLYKVPDSVSIHFFFYFCVAIIECALLRPDCVVDLCD